MGGTGDELEKWGADVIFGRARGPMAALARIFLRGLSFIYWFLIKFRLKGFRQHWFEQSNLGTMTISVGNLTVGGTGKTPVVELLSRTLRDRGRHVAVLSRGYKSKPLTELQEWSDWSEEEREDLPKIVSDGSRVLLGASHAGDEPFMLAKNLPGVSVIVDKDRVNGGRFAVSELGADTLVLDDGLQYLRLDHELDIVLVDQSSPFGTRALLPRGTLREPMRNLCRASHIIVTKCQGPTDEALLAKMRKYNPTAEVIETTHGPKYLERVFGDGRLALDSLQDKYVAAISGIAVPESFEGLLKKLGANVEFHRTFSDHHAFSKKDVDRFMGRCVQRDIDLIVTTEKDAVRFPEPSEMDVDIYFLRIEIEILKGQEVWDRIVDRIATPPSRPPGGWAEERLLVDPLGAS
ncbi:MAG: tetraacyldisaccharide 4'-kinase [Akkermansiaceae bacterium]|jgi:tetraacyldisaccharide 4'-kinase|nr:tetraacyldisaccharide 4'-kinase [Akkermansiaceae bacterium]